MVGNLLGEDLDQYKNIRSSETKSSPEKPHLLMRCVKVTGLFASSLSDLNVEKKH